MLWIASVHVWFQSCPDERDTCRLIEKLKIYEFELGHDDSAAAAKNKKTNGVRKVKV